MSLPFSVPGRIVPPTSIRRTDFFFYLALVTSAWKKYKHLWQRVDLPAHHPLLREGEVCQKIYFIQQGSARAWFDHADRDICFQFFFEKDIAYASESLRHETPSPFSIATLEPSILYWIGAAGLEIIRRDAAVYNTILDKAVQRQSRFMQHFFTFLKDSPQQRYEDLLLHRPEIIRRVPLQYIASYLGITQVSLSRIRARGRII